MATLTKTFTALSNGGTANGTLRLTFEYSQDVLANTSTVKLILVEFKTSAQVGTFVLDGVIRIAGITQVTYSNAGTSADSCYCSSLDTYATVGSALDLPEVVIHHAQNGNGSIPVYLGPRSTTGYNDFNLFNVSVSSGSSHVSAGTTNVALPKISDTLATATPLSPVNTVEDGSAPITFRWTLANASGLPPTKTDLQTSADGASWTDLATVPNGADLYVSDGELSSGTVYWRARAYNRDNVAGEWSEPVSFIVVAAPDAPTVLCDGAPFATISWRAAGQQAYRLTVDSVAYGPFFGSQKSFTLQDPLPDGQHSAAVEVQGAYGMWSAPGSVTFTVLNVPGDAVELTGSFDLDAHLSWSTDSTAADFLIYCDGARIGHSSGESFTDRLRLGEHDYTVVNRLPDGNYTRSNDVTGFLCTRSTVMAALSGGDWVAIPLTEESDPVQGFSRSRAFDLRHYTGAELPELELSPYEDRSGSYACAFRCAAQAAPLLALFGRTVIVKSKGGNVVIGPFCAYEKRQQDLYLAITFQIPAAHVEDFVDADA